MRQARAIHDFRLRAAGIAVGQQSTRTGPYRRRALPNSAHRSARTLPDARPHDRTYRPSRSSRPARSQSSSPKRCEYFDQSATAVCAVVRSVQCGSSQYVFACSGEREADSEPDRQAILGRAARAARHAPGRPACIPTDTSASSRDRAQSVRHRSRRYCRVKQHFWTRAVRTCLETRGRAVVCRSAGKARATAGMPRAMRQSSNASRTGVS